MDATISFQIILHAGNARSAAMEAMRAARNNDPDLAKERMEYCNQELINAHKIQTKLIQSEVRGEGVELSMLLIHAQDHLMNTITVRELAEEIIDIRLSK